jgi:adenylate cyclase
MSGDPGQEYFSDGMTEDLITDLSKISALDVIAAATTATFKGNVANVRDVASELGVRYVVQGSVRRADGLVRISAQLVDGQTGKFVWAERYDRNHADVFALQDDVLGRIISSLSAALTPEERRRLEKPLTANPEAYDLYLQGLQQESFFTGDGNLEARRLLSRAIELDPGFAAAYAHLAQTYSLAVENGWKGGDETLAAKAIEAALKATRLDPELPFAFWSLGRIYSRAHVGDPERAKIAFKRAVVLNPNYADAFMFLALMHIFTGEAEKAPELIAKAMRMNPRYPFWYLQGLGNAQFFLGDYQASVASLKASIERNPSVPWLHYFLLASYGQLGLKQEAEWEMAELEALGQTATITAIMAVLFIHDQGYRRIFENALRKAGVPE